jgi:alkylation response protein AidB-like acyl-CoA dehydrogenase
MTPAAAQPAETDPIGTDPPASSFGKALFTGYRRVMKEFGGYDGSPSVVMEVHQSIGMKPIHLFGSDAQKARFLPQLTAGRELAGFALTEPGASSGMHAISSYAQRQADGSWVLNGEKRWIGNGGKDVVCVFARTDHDPVALILEKGIPGFKAPDRYDTLGLRGNDLRRLTFRDVRVPKENMLGEPSDGLRIAMHTLNNGRMLLDTASSTSPNASSDWPSSTPPPAASSAGPWPSSNWSRTRSPGWCPICTASNRWPT